MRVTMKYTKYTAEQKTKLLEHAERDDAIPYRELGKLYGVNRYTAENWCVAAGLKRKIGGRYGHKTSKFVRAIWDALDSKWADYIREHAGDGVKALEEATGHNWRTVQNIAKRNGIQLRHKEREREYKPRENDHIFGMPTIDSRVKRCSDCAVYTGTVCIYAFKGMSDKCEFYRQLKETCTD